MAMQSRRRKSMNSLEERIEKLYMNSLEERIEKLYDLIARHRV